jgi:hypothetical protein
MMTLKQECLLPLKQRETNQEHQALRHILKLDQRFAADNAVEELHKYNAKLARQVLALLAKCQINS